VAAVEEGTARAARVTGHLVAGKTGTAQNPGFDHALFAAYAPAERPQVAAVVLLENRGHGGSVAAPVARRMFSAYFGIPDSLLAQTVVESD
jgi:cell division protein FtsI/penicillin-binding protein 2